MLQEVIHRSPVPLPDSNIGRLNTAPPSEVDNLCIRQEDYAGARLSSPDTEITSIFSREKKLGIITAYLFKDILADQKASTRYEQQIPALVR